MATRQHTQFTLPSGFMGEEQNRRRDSTERSTEWVIEHEAGV